MNFQLFIDYMIHNFFVVGVLVSFWQLWRTFYNMVFWRSIVNRKDLEKLFDGMEKFEKENIENAVYPPQKASARTRLETIKAIRNSIDVL